MSKKLIGQIEDVLKEQKKEVKIIQVEDVYGDKFYVNKFDYDRVKEVGDRAKVSPVRLRLPLYKKSGKRFADIYSREGKPNSIHIENIKKVIKEL